MGRVILHCDLNCFYASVELLSHPELRDVPVAVCGDPKARHGIILAKNEPAKQKGVVTAETIWQARRKCPDLVLLPPHHELYERYSQRVNAVYEEYTDLVEPFGIDESWLDLTGSLHLFGGDAVAVAAELRRRMREELGLTLSIGVSFNKVFAKLGSDYKKPDATTVFSQENWKELVWPLPVGALLYVGSAARKALGQFGITTIGQLAACPPQLPERLLGKLGTQLYAYANGEDRAPVLSREQREPVKSVGNSTTFDHDLTSWEEVRTGVAVLSDSVALRLRRQGLCAGGIQIGIRSADFKNLTRQKQLSRPTHLTRELTAQALELVRAAWKAPSPIRLLSVTAIHLTPESEAYEQLDFFRQTAAVDTRRQEQLERAMDGIRDRYGADAIAFGPSRLERKERDPDDPF